MGAIGILGVLVLGAALLMSGLGILLLVISIFKKDILPHAMRVLLIAGILLLVSGGLCTIAFA